MRRTRSGLVDTSSEPRNNMATLKAVAAALQSASLPTGPLGQRRKREGSPGLMTGDTRKYVPEHQDFLSLQQKPMGSSQPEMLLSRGLTMMIMLFTVLSRNQLLVRTLRRDKISGLYPSCGLQSRISRSLCGLSSWACRVWEMERRPPPEHSTFMYAVHTPSPSPA